MLRLVLFDLEYGTCKCHYKHASGCNIANFDAIFSQKQVKSYKLDSTPNPETRKTLQKQPRNLLQIFHIDRHKKTYKIQKSPQKRAFSSGSIDHSHSIVAGGFDETS